jgi:uncharacterized protein YjgD (DUF1641 family)
MGRDKFAALASRAAAASGDAAAPASTEATSGSVQNEASATPANASTSAPPRRDKLAALASRAAANPPPTGRGDKFAAMAANSASSVGDVAIENPEQKKPKDEEKIAKMKERLSKRREILQNLDRAEELTCKLLEIAHKTATELQDLSTSPNISELSRSYRSVLQELHPLLSNDTQNLIQPYQNHSNETKQSMYAASVEMRLARERTQVLKAFTEMAKADSSSSDEQQTNSTNKRPRDESEIL